MLVSYQAPKLSCYEHASASQNVLQHQQMWGMHT
jgi:hypothetical protein